MFYGHFSLKNKLTNFCFCLTFIFNKKESQIRQFFIILLVRFLSVLMFLGYDFRHLAKISKQQLKKGLSQLLHILPLSSSSDISTISICSSAKFIIETSLEQVIFSLSFFGPFFFSVSMSISLKPCFSLCLSAGLPLSLKKLKCPINSCNVSVLDSKLFKIQKPNVTKVSVF